MNQPDPPPPQPNAFIEADLATWPPPWKKIPADPFAFGPINASAMAEVNHRLGPIPVGDDWQQSAAESRRVWEEISHRGRLARRLTAESN